MLFQTALWILLQGSEAAQGASGKDKLASEVDALFFSTNTDVLRIQIEVPPPSLQKLRGRGWSWGGNRERPEVMATVREGGLTYTNVALHLKGSAGSFQPVDAKPGLTLNFDKAATGQHFHGLSKLSLNNSVQDPSFMTEKICRELFENAGVPAPRADYALVELNGRKLGLYVLLEGYNRQFLRRHFKNTKGNLYDGGFLRDIDAKKSTNSGDNPDQSDLNALLEAGNAPRSERFARLEKVLDMERFLTFIAMEVMVCHWDGYAMNKNNYRVYHDLDTDRIVFMPHGMDQMFGVMMAETGMPIRPPMQGFVARALMDTAEGRRRYYERLAHLDNTYFDLESLTNHVHQIASRLQPVLAQISPSAVAEHEQAISSLCDRIAQRKQSLEEQLAGGPGKTLAFDNEGIARLAVAGWSCLTNYGRPMVTQETSSDGKLILRISAARGSSVACWRTKVTLEDGHYSFEGRMQTKDVSADPRDARAGAGLRISNRLSPRKTLGSSDWSNVVYEFEVPDGIHDVELVCELRAAQGEVWFDATSLQLVRK